MSAVTISVVVPTLDEEAQIGPLLAALATEPTPHETIVVDGGSADRTAEIARRLGARVLAAPRGRGQQLAAGVAAAAGETLLLLHADTRLPTGALARIEAILAGDPALVGGNFRLLFDGDRPFDRWLEGFYAAIRRRGLYYGDSGIFVRRHVCERIGGIRPIALMEDYDFTRRLERAGPTACIAEPPLVTSSRRFAGRGRAEIVWGWLRLHALYHLGVAPDRLAALYGRGSR